MAVLHDLLFGTAGSPFYTLGSFFVPDLAFDAIGTALTCLFTPEATGRLFLGLTLATGLWGLVVLNRVVTGRWSGTPLVAALLLYNLVSILGFFSYLFGLALVPWALAGRMRLPASRPVLGFAVGVAIAINLLFCHALAFAIYATFWAGVTAASALGRRIVWRGALTRSLELAPAIALFLFMPRSQAPTIDYGSHVVQAKLIGIFEALLSGSLAGDVAMSLGVIAFAWLLVSSARVTIRPDLAAGVLCLALLYLLAPMQLGDGANIDKRIPIAVVLLGLACADIRLRWTATSQVLTCCLITMIIAKQCALALLWMSFDPELDAMIAAVASTPPGAIILQSECHPGTNLIDRTYDKWQPSLTHIAAVASFDDRRFVAGNWAIAGQQPISLKPRYRGYYDLQKRFASSSCAPQMYRTQLAAIRGLARQATATSPTYFLLLRPPGRRSLDGPASLRAAGPDFELYAVDPL